uniref:Immunoglobulin V-set domain-containing protein n=1 Tax=Loxodonta africana TaxID=9785 RepID=G3UNM9_LOXAF
MGSKFLPCMVLCLLTPGPMGAMVTQSPKYHVTRVGKSVNLSCSQNLKHNIMFWYQQKHSQAPKLLFYYYNKDFNNETDTSDNFQPSRPNTSVGLASALRAWGTRLCTCVPAVETQRCSFST